MIGCLNACVFVNSSILSSLAALCKSVVKLFVIVVVKGVVRREAGKEAGNLTCSEKIVARKQVVPLFSLALIIALATDAGSAWCPDCCPPRDHKIKKIKN